MVAAPARDYQNGWHVRIVGPVATDIPEQIMERLRL